MSYYLFLIKIVDYLLWSCFRKSRSLEDSMAIYWCQAASHVPLFVGFLISWISLPTKTTKIGTPRSDFTVIHNLFFNRGMLISNKLRTLLFVPFIFFKPNFFTNTCVYWDNYVYMRDIVYSYLLWKSFLNRYIHGPCPKCLLPKCLLFFPKNIIQMCLFNSQL